MSEVEEQQEQTLQRSERQVPTNLPVYRAAHFSMQASSNECHLILGETSPIVTEAGLPDSARVVLVAILSMSPQSAKDLSLVLGDFVVEYEKMYGHLTTDFTKKRDDGSDRKEQR